MGRSSIDLYANEIGAPFHEIKSFGAFVGGCPTNIAVGVSRLGAKVALLTAVGDDPVGDFIVHYLKKEKVATQFIPRKKGRRTSAVILGIQPPDKFPLVFYRDNCADREINVNDVKRAPVKQSRMLLVTGTGLSKEPSRAATLFAAQTAKKNKKTVVLDLDVRLDQWSSPLEYGKIVRKILPFINIVIGTEEELKALVLKSTKHAKISGSQVSSPKVSGNLERAKDVILGAGVSVLVIKRGKYGSAAFFRTGEHYTSRPFPVKVVNVLGAGDAYAAGFLFGVLNEWYWEKCLRFGNACGALMVTKHGCSNFMPTEKQVWKFIKTHSQW